MANPPNLINKSNSQQEIISISDVLLIVLRPDHQDYQGTAVAVWVRSTVRESYLSVGAKSRAMGKGTYTKEGFIQYPERLRTKQWSNITNRSICPTLVKLAKAVQS
ncbi:hypothetical protein H6G00_21675 [Leptolyngbya sp. FACHB-541]|uniref:hypothetical protein n=1 Tax=Leptolyngbya sp. FACHB-541 TaxID=2692810 RepID=UPI001685F252|nr:hypothetical protein [Leptolyngbya sp. FACHB-541]MBD1999191.1 hypothetical protein [Leptolyngbya sp. FACHB-541]